jgi:hypothetical protein
MCMLLRTVVSKICLVATSVSCHTLCSFHLVIARSLMWVNILLMISDCSIHMHPGRKFITSIPISRTAVDVALSPMLPSALVIDTGQTVMNWRQVEL